MRLKLTPGQSCYLHGWLNPRPHLAWTHIRANPRFTLQHLLSAGVDLDDLHRLQPDVSEWIKAGRVTMADCPLMAELWGAHPVKDFRADLGDVAGFRWSVDSMIKMGLTYRDLVELGLTPASMILFTHVTLHGWSQLGYTRADAAQVSEAVLVALFCMPKQEVLRSLK